MTTPRLPASAFPPATPRPPSTVAAATLPSAEPSERATLAQLGERLVGEAGRIAAATCAWLLLLAEFDRRDGWAQAVGIRSMAHWLSWRCGVGLGTAQEQVRVARALPALPRLRAAFAAGALSYSQVRALTRAVGLVAEQTLVELAEHASGAQLDRLVAGLRRATRAEDEADRHRARRASWFVDDDGMVVIRARLAPEEGAAVTAALEHACRLVPQEPDEPDRVALATRPPAGTDPHAQPWADRGPRTRADALVDLARVYAAAPDRLRQSPGGPPDPVRVVIHADLATLQSAARCATDGSVAPGPAAPPQAAGARTSAVPAAGGGEVMGAFEGGGGVHPSVLARLLCDRQVDLVCELSPGTGVDLGRARRTPRAALRRSVLRRDGHACRFPGCGSRRHLHLHHVRHWIVGGATDAANLLTLCGFHHRRLHEGNFLVGLGTDGGVVFLTAAGATIPLRPDRTAPRAAVPLSEDAALTAAAERAVAGSALGVRGERMDLGYAVAVLLDARSAGGQGGA